MSKLVAVECGMCGELLDDEERLNSRLHEDGDLICDRCYTDEYEFTCYYCWEYAPIEDQHKMLVVNEECGGLKRGVYRIIDSPYYTSNYFNMWFNPECFEFVCAVPKDLLRPEEMFLGGSYPTGHLCQGCQYKVTPPRPRLFGNPEIRSVAA